MSDYQQEVRGLAETRKKTTATGMIAEAAKFSIIDLRKGSFLLVKIMQVNLNRTE